MQPGNQEGRLERRPSLCGEFTAFLRAHKLWWIAPLVIVAILFATLIVLSGTSTTPFIYQSH